MAYGTINADVIQSSVPGVSLGAGNATVFKNRIINGDMRIDQRNAGASVTGNSGVYTLDRWLCEATQSSKFTVQQNAGSITPPTGFINYLGCTSSSAYSVGASDFFAIEQRVEGLNIEDLAWGTANAKTITISAWVYSSLTGTFGGSLLNSSNGLTYPFSYSISVANTWTQISVTIVGPTTGTWLTTNGIGIKVLFSLGAGSTYSGTAGSWTTSLYTSATGATSVVGTSGATFYITGVQLEVGSSATGFEVVDYGTQLIMCQRYFQKYASPHLVGGIAGSAAASRVGATLPVWMRADPTAVYTSSLSIFDGTTSAVISSINVSYCTTQSMEFDFNTAASLTAGRPSILYIQSGGSITLSAEL